MRRESISNGTAPVKVRVRSREEIAAELRALLAPVANALASLLLEERGAGDAPPLSPWPGSARQYRRTEERLRARGVQVDSFLIGRRVYLRSADLERLPTLLGERPATLPASEAANDAAMQDTEQSAERFASVLLASHGKKLAPVQKARRA